MADLRNFSYSESVVLLLQPIILGCPNKLTKLYEGLLSLLYPHTSSLSPLPAPHPLSVAPGPSLQQEVAKQTPIQHIKQESNEESPTTCQVHKVEDNTQERTREQEEEHKYEALTSMPVPATPILYQNSMCLPLFQSVYTKATQNSKTGDFLAGEVEGYGEDNDWYLQSAAVFGGTAFGW
jgi:hypothetical protein